MSTGHVFKSKYPDIHIPDNVDLTSFIFSRSEDAKDRVALVDAASGRSYTNGQVRALVKKTAAGLAAKGITKGSVVCLYSPNLPEYAFVFLGAATLGAACSLANPTYNPEELSKILIDSKPSILVTVAPFLANAKAANALSGEPVKEFFVFGEAPEGASPFAALLNNDGTVPGVTIDPKEDIVALPYSSGTTGLPKGVMLTHYNIIANICQYTSLPDKYNDDDVFLGLLPMFHIYGLVVILLSGLALGKKIVTLMKFELEPFLKTIQDYKVTLMHIVPPIVLAMAKHPLVDKYDLKSLRMVMSGAAPLGADLTEQFRKRLNTPIKQGYGLTETSPVTNANPDMDIRDGSGGVLLPNLEAKIVHVETGEVFGPGSENVGELWIRGPNVMKGYYNKPAETAHCIDSDGFFHTGDIGYFDQDGYLFIVDRLKELIKYKGFQVAPAELEDLLMSHPDIADCAVIGVPDEEAGELPRAYVVKGPGKTISEEDVKTFVAGKLSHFKHLRGGVSFIDAVPKSPSGKILRRVLRDQATKKQ